MMVDGRFAFLNKYAISLFGAEDSESLIGTPVIERFHSITVKACSNKSKFL